jgi:hypothetical protein
MKTFCVLALIAAFAVIDAAHFDGKYVNAAHAEILYLLRGY